MRGALRPRPFLWPERVQELRLALLIAGPASDIAEELAAITCPGDREWRRQHQIGIVFLLRARMMLQMIEAISAGFGKDRIGAEPLAPRQVDFLARRQTTMRAIMHREREPELAGADDAHRQQ